MSDTPRTDKLSVSLLGKTWHVSFEIMSEHACALERELSAARAEIARLNGQTRWQCACGGTDCAGQKENEQLRKDVQFVIDHADGWLESGEVKCGPLWMAEQLGAALDAQKGKT